MRLTVTKALNFVNRDDQQYFKKYLRRIYANTSKIGPSKESLNVDFQFFDKILFWVAS